MRSMTSGVCILFEEVSRKSAGEIEFSPCGNSGWDLSEMQYERIVSRIGSDNPGFMYCLDPLVILNGGN